MFAYLAAALGSCKIIIEEDCGEFFVTSPDFKRPDFRILTDEGKEFFIEVKNFNQTDPREPFILKSDYAESLQDYANAFKKPLLFAIFWTRWQMWTLVSLDCFSKGDRTYSMEFLSAPKHDQMAILGDCLIGIPKPLALRFYTDPQKPRKLEANTHVRFTIGRCVFVCAGKEITDDFEKRLAMFFLLYGTWEDVEQPGHVENGEVIWFEIQGMKQDSNPGQNFMLVGRLSEMITRQFNSMTVEKGKVLRIDPQVQPDKLGVIIPKDFKGDVLGIWRFMLQPERPVFDGGGSAAVQ
jgi:hypothetical protein